MSSGPDKRTTPRQRVLKTAYIVISDKAPKLECTIRNISTTGACLELSTPFAIPANFDAVINGERRSCRAVWRTDKKIGVEFN